MTHGEKGVEVKLLPELKERGVEDTVCSVVHNIVSCDVTVKIHNRKKPEFLT